jgi:hypothetical protein
MCACRSLHSRLNVNNNRSLYRSPKSHFPQYVCFHKRLNLNEFGPPSDRRWATFQQSNLSPLPLNRPPFQFGRFGSSCRIWKREIGAAHSSALLPFTLWFLFPPFFPDTHANMSLEAKVVVLGSQGSLWAFFPFTKSSLYSNSPICCVTFNHPNFRGRQDFTCRTICYKNVLAKLRFYDWRFFHDKEIVSVNDSSSVDGWRIWERVWFACAPAKTRSHGEERMYICTRRSRRCVSMQLCCGGIFAGGRAKRQVFDRIIATQEPIQTFLERYSNVRAPFYRVVDNCKVRLQIWDTAGQERFRSMVSVLLLR